MEKLHGYFASGTTQKATFYVRPPDADFLSAYFAAKLPDEAAEMLRAYFAAGSAQQGTSFIRPPSDQMVRGFFEAYSTQKATFWIRPADDSFLRAFYKIRKPVRLNFRTTPDPASVRPGLPELEAFPTGTSETQIFVTPIYQYVKGVDRTWSQDIWYAKGQVARPADDVVLSVVALGASNALGKEIADNGYLYAKRSDVGSYTSLATGVALSLGPAQPNSAKTINFKLNIPVGAASGGTVMLGIRIEWLWSSLYGDMVYGLKRYGAVSKSKDLLLRIQIL